MTAKGRGLRAPSATARFTSEGVVLRVDDDRLPEFWLELTLDVDELREILHEVLALRHEHAQRQPRGDVA